jgi:hypothetical protein
MVSNVIEDHGWSVGTEFLDTLRKLRQQYEETGRIRFILCGSVGLHLVVEQLRIEHKYKGAPTNDMAQATLGGMSEADTREMCKRYLLEENIDVPDFDGVAAQMLASTDGLPLYIQWICQQIQQGARKSVTPEDIEPIVDGLLNSPDVEWFEYAVKRLDTYYGKCAEQAHAILESLCRQDAWAPEDEVVNEVKSGVPDVTSRDVKDCLAKLWWDHYLSRETGEGRRYRFQYEIMRKWWKLNRG